MRTPSNAVRGCSSPHLRQLRRVAAPVAAAPSRGACASRRPSSGRTRSTAWPAPATNRVAGSRRRAPGSNQTTSAGLAEADVQLVVLIADQPFVEQPDRLDRCAVEHAEEHRVDRAGDTADPVGRRHRFPATTWWRRPPPPRTVSSPPEPAARRRSTAPVRAHRLDGPSDVALRQLAVTVDAHDDGADPRADRQVERGRSRPARVRAPRRGRRRARPDSAAIRSVPSSGRPDTEEDPDRARIVLGPHGSDRVGEVGRLVADRHHDVDVGPSGSVGQRRARRSHTATQHDPDRPEEDLHVDHDRPVDEVLQVVSELVLGVGAVPTVDLGQPVRPGGSSLRRT